MPSNQTLQFESPDSQDQLDDNNEDLEDFEDPEEVDYVTEESADYSVTETIETEDYSPDVRENEVNTEITLGEVLDEIFYDPALPQENRNDIPRSPQFFVPTPLPAQGQPILGNPLQDDHAFHDQFIDSPEREGSFDEHRLRDEQDLSLAEMLHHHEEVDDHLQTNIINILSEERPQGPKGRKVLKKRPIRIKIPAKMSQNLQSITIPESLHLPDVHELPSTLEITSRPQRQHLDLESLQQEPRQPKALHVFTDSDDSLDQRTDSVFDTSRLNLPTTGRQQQSDLPQDFQPIFTSEADRTRQVQLGQNIDTTASQFATPASVNQIFSGQSPQLNLRPAPPQFSPFTPILRQAEDYIFNPQQVSALPSPGQSFNFQQVSGRDQSQSFAVEENPIQTQQSFVEAGLPVRSQKAFPQQAFNPNSLNSGTPTENRFAPPPSRPPPPPQPPQSRPPPPPPQSRPPPARAPPSPPASLAIQNEQSLFQMINREVAERPVRTKLEMNDAIHQNKPK